MNTNLRRILLAITVILAAFVGLWAEAFPRGFYDSFPGFGLSWISEDGPFNEHMIRDVGSLYLGLGAASLAAIFSRSATAGRVVGLAWALFGVLHFGYHLLHPEGSTLDRIGTIVSLGVSLLLGILLTLPESPHGAGHHDPIGRKAMKIAIAGGTGTVGRHVVNAAIGRGHETVVLSRSTGVDLMAGTGLGATLSGVDVLIDVSSTATAAAAESVNFFGTVTANLLAAELAAGVRHHVALSIIGAAKTNAAYYAGKKVQEDLVTASDVPWTIVRAAQFHEFVTQVIPQGRFGPLQVVPSMLAQPIAAAEVGAILVEFAEGAPQGFSPEVAGPRVERMPELVRRYLRARGDRRPVIPLRIPGAWGRSMRDGSLLPAAGARLGTQTFDEWLSQQNG